MDELEQYQKLAAIQKTFVDALLGNGFKWKYWNTYELDSITIDVSAIKNTTDFVAELLKIGKTLKMWQIQSALGL